MKYIKLLMAILIMGVLLSISLSYFGKFIPINGLNWSNNVFRNNVKNAICIFLVGSGMGVSGYIIQSIFRNELATPATIGITPIATFAIIISTILGLSTILTAITSMIISLAVSLLLFFWIFKTKKSISNIVIIGLIVSGLIVGVNNLIVSTFNIPQYISSIISNNKLTFSWNTIYFLAPFVVIGVLVLLFLGKKIQIIEKGNDTAVNLGINKRVIVPLALAITILITVASVMLYGMVTFISLAAPLLVRYVLRTKNIWIDITLSIFITICFLFLGDILIRYKSYLIVAIVPIVVSSVLITGRLLWK